MPNRPEPVSLWTLVIFCGTKTVVRALQVSTDVQIGLNMPVMQASDLCLVFL